MKKLNYVLNEFEHIIKAEAELELPVLDNLIACGGISDYEYQAIISYCIDRKRVAKDDVNLKSVMLGYSRICDGDDHCDGYGLGEHNFRHCYLFHSLYDHHIVLWEDFLEINRVRMDFLCTRQYMLEVEKAPLYFPEMNVEFLKVEKWIKAALASGTKWERDKTAATGIFSPVWDLKCSLDFYLSERSRHYRDNEDNDYAILKIADFSKLDDGCDHNRRLLPPGHAFNTHSQCWLMSELVAQLSGKGEPMLEQIEDTGTIWVDIDISYGLESGI